MYKSIGENNVTRSPFINALETSAPFLYPRKTSERRPGVFIVNFERISHLVLVFLLLTLNM